MMDTSQYLRHPGSLAAEGAVVSVECDRRRLVAELSAVLQALLQVRGLTKQPPYTTARVSGIV